MAKNKPWMKLDNAAKIFPSTSNKRDTKVFRFSCELKEEIDGVKLQDALEKTIPLFPFYRSILKRGFFWYYLEESDVIPSITVEDKSPCSPLYEPGRKNLLFRVSYYQKRIHLETYHVLTDGTGALEFLKTLILFYFDRPDLVICSNQSSLSEKRDDSFEKYYQKPKKSRKKKKRIVFHPHGLHLSENRIGIIEGMISTREAKKTAHTYQTTITVLITAILIDSIYEEMYTRERKKEIVIEIPVNLRNFFASKSARNFFGVMRVSYQNIENVTLEHIIKSIHHQFKEELTEEKLREHMNHYSMLEHNFFARIVPLFVKDQVLKFGAYLAAREISCSLSNIGKVEMPKEVEDKVALFDFFSSTDKLQLCICSYQDALMVSFSSTFVNTNIQKNFFRTLSKLGFRVEVTGNNDRRGL